MFWKSKKEVDIEEVNEVIHLSKNILKIVFVLIAALLIYIVTSLFHSWHVFEFIKNILSILSPLFIGFAIAWLLDPAVSWLKKKGVNRILGTMLVFILVLGGLGFLGYLIYPSLTEQINEVASSIPTLIENGTKMIDQLFVNLSHMSGYDLTDIKLQIFDTMNKFGTDLATSLPTLTMNIVSNIISGGVNLIFGIIVGFYMLFDFQNVRKHLFTFIPKKYHKEAARLVDQLNRILRSFIQGTLLIAGILFIFQSIGLTLAGMNAPLVFGLFCAITDIIPYIGPWIGGVPVVLIAFTINPMVGFLTLVSVLVCQTLENYFLQPIVMGKTMKLHPVTIMMGLLIFGYYFGIIGMIVATPLISTGKLIFQFLNEKYHFMDRINEENGRKNVEEEK